MTKRSAHRDHLPLVMKSVSQDVVKNECGSAYLAVPIGKAKFGICV